MYFLDDESNNLSIAALHLQIDAIRNGVITVDNPANTVDNPAKLIQHYEQQLAVLESKSSLGKRNQIAIQQSIADLPLSVRYNAARNYSTLYELAQSQSIQKRLL